MDKQKMIIFKENEYLVKFPTMGQLQDIEAFKIAYTNGRYADMVTSGLRTHDFNLDVADSVSYFRSLCPQLVKDLEIKNWGDIDPFLAKDLIKCYKKQLIPWLKPILDDLYSFDTEDDQDDEEEQTEG